MVVKALTEALSLLADVRMAELPDAVARLTLSSTPVLWIDSGTPRADRIPVLLDALRALTEGVEAVELARVVRPLRSVS